MPKDDRDKPDAETIELLESRELASVGGRSDMFGKDSDIIQKGRAESYWREIFQSFMCSPDPETKEIRAVRLARALYQGAIEGDVNASKVLLDRAAGAVPRQSSGVRVSEDDQGKAVIEVVYTSHGD